MRRIKGRQNDYRKCVRIIKRLVYREYGPNVTRRTLGLVLDQSTVLYQRILKTCTLTDCDDGLHDGPCPNLFREDRARPTVLSECQSDSSGDNIHELAAAEHGLYNVIQRRINGALHFNKTWNEYKDGFGDLLGEHWIGNDVLHLLTERGRTLLIRVLGKDSGSTWKYAKYSDVHVSDEASKYRLTFRQGSYIGNAGDDFERKVGQNHNNMMFSTKDRDNDRSSRSCAVRYEGGWWFNSCYGGCLNCKQLFGNGGHITFKSSWMMIK
ncbi:hypothetical protein FSP39_020925 [Pinctada imbricata]|uniref:Fibrinogen C-terminal domain-containing protein n=1 Tax=Pinctada imbricata TaxID=66713 RepID=A0AA89BJP3_PINIB|nr:hypothetical protein FSP39_020925 [Pinctada imbricata]